MYSIEIRLQGIDQYSKVSSDDLCATELLVESIVSEALLELFGVVTVGDVTVNFFSPENYHNIIFPPPQTP